MFFPRPAPAVDRLVGITRRAQVRFELRQRRDDLVLRFVRVLILIDQDEAEPLVEFRSQFFVLGQQQRDVNEQVVKIDRVRSEQSLLIGRINLGHDRFEMRADPFAISRDVQLGREQFVLRVTDPRPDLVGGKVGRVEVLIAQHLLDDLLLIAGVVD